MNDYTNKLQNNHKYEMSEGSEPADAPQIEETPSNALEPKLSTEPSRLSPLSNKERIEDGRCTDVSLKAEGLPAESTESVLQPATESIADIACKPFNEMEAGITSEIDRVTYLADLDPLAGLDAVISSLYAVDAEIFKALAPALLENQQLRASEFSRKSQISDVTRGEMRALTSFLKLQQEMVKLGAARVRVRDELVRRKGKP